MASKPAGAAEQKPTPPTDTLAEQRAKQRRRFILDPQFQLAEQYRTIWIATIAAGHTVEDLKRPDYWMNVANKLRHYSHIECYAEDGSFYCELLVVGKTMSSARVAVIREVDLRAENAVIDMATELAAFEIRYGGPTNGFRVIEKVSKRIIKAGIQTEEEARKWLVEYVARPDRGYMEERQGSEPQGEVAQQDDSTAAKLRQATAGRKAGADA